MLTGRLLPPLLAAEPPLRHFQVEPGNEILEGFWFKLTPIQLFTPTYLTVLISLLLECFCDPGSPTQSGTQYFR